MRNLSKNPFKASKLEYARTYSVVVSSDFYSVLFCFIDFIVLFVFFLIHCKSHY